MNPLTEGHTLPHSRSAPSTWSIAAMLVAVLLSGCVMNWQAQSAPPAQVIQSSGESEIRVTLNAGNSVVVRDPWVEEDSLIGWQQPPGDPGEVAVVRRAYALSDVRTVSVKKSNTGANIAIAAAIGAAALVVSVAGVILADVKQIAIKKPDGTATAIWVAVAGAFVVFVSLMAVLFAGLSE